MANIITSQDLQKKTAQKAEELSAIESAENKEPRYAIEYLPGSDTPGMQEQLTLLPSRFTSFIYSRRALPLKIGLMTLVFITALYTKVYTGEYQHLVNNHLGGVFYVLFGSLALSALFPKMKMYLPVVLATGVTCLLEFVQGYQFSFMTELTRFKPLAYLFGNSYNPTDFLYYGAGGLIALLVIWFIHDD